MKPRRVFVVGARVPSGGTYMAYHVGRIIHEEWGHELVAVEVAPEAERHTVWSYEHLRATTTLDALARQAGPRDVLVCSPSFSVHMPGLTFPGLKLMYVQGVNTCKVIDGFFDKYVAVSPFVAAFLRRTYGMAPPVIAPFLHHDHRPERLTAWEERPERSVVVSLKVEAHGERFLDHFRSVLDARHPGVAFAPTRIPPNTPHREFLRILSGCRYFLGLSAVEGFGLPALEAMSCGAATAGFHGGGGTSYFTGGWRKNALVCGYPDFPRLADLFARLLSDDALARKLARRGPRAAAAYTYSRFRRAWIEELGPHLR